LEIINYAENMTIMIDKDCYINEGLMFFRYKKSVLLMLLQIYVRDRLYKTVLNLPIQ